MGTSNEAGALDDKCSAGGGSTDATRQGAAMTYNITPPAGSPAGTFAVDVGGGSNAILADATIGDEGSNLTLGCWVDQQTTSASNAIIAKYGTAGTLIGHGSDAEPSLFRGWGTATPNIATTADNGTGWKHVAITANSNGEQKIFVNGVEDCGGACPTNGTGHVNNGDNLAIGSRSNDTEIQEGDLYECFMYKGVLTPAQICEIVTTGLDGTADSGARDTLTGGC